MEPTIQLSTTNYVPAIGLRGHYKLLPPFDAISNGIHVPSDPQSTSQKPVSSILLTCKSIEKISSLVGLGTDVFGTVYEPFGLTEDEYKEDLKNDVNIITLWSDGGVIITFPGKYLAEYPNTNGVGYLVNHLHILLPAFPHYFSFSQVISDIQGLVQLRLGIPKASVKLVRASEIQMVDEDVHMATVAKRKNAASESTPELEVLRLKQLVQDLEKERDDLLDYVANNMPP